MKVKSQVFDRSRVYEQLIYLVMWLLVFLFPLLNEEVQSARGSDFSWKDIFRWWVGMVPFLIAFVIHNHFLIPGFLFGGKLKAYVLSAVCLLLLFGAGEYGVMEVRRTSYPKPVHRVHGDRPVPGAPLDLVPDMPRPVPGERPPGPPADVHRNGPMFPAPMVFNMLMAFFMFGLNLAIVFMFKYQREQENRRTLENMRLKDELRYLKAQINPHFFMNMLNNIHATVEVDPVKAQEMILELSKLMRYVLYDGDNEKVTFAKEVHFLTTYISLMRQRYPDSKVGISLTVPPDPSENVFLPPLLYIAFVENAFKHGISYRIRSEVEISLEENDGQIGFRCRNTKHIVEADEKSAGGVGLENVRRRLDLIYGNTYSLFIEDRKDEYMVTLIIPTL